MKRAALSSILALAAVGAAGCGVAGALRAQPPAAAREGGAVLRGTIEPPPFFRLLAATSDIAAHSVVVLRDEAGAVQAAGTTDASGAFTVLDAKAGFGATDGAAYTLEAVKRVDGALMTLRTVLVRDGGGWRSPTGPTIKLNLATTTVAKLWVNNRATLPAADVLDTVDPATGEVGAVGSFSAAEMLQLQASMLKAMADGFNPSGRLGKDQTLIVSSQADLDKIAAYSEAAVFYVFGATDITEVKMPNLKHCLAIGAASSPNLRKFSLPALERGEYFEIFGNAQLAEIDMPALRHWGGMTLASNTALERLSFPPDSACEPYSDLFKAMFPVAEALYVSGNTALRSIALPDAGPPASVSVVGNPALTTLGTTPWGRTSYATFQLDGSPLLDDLAPLGNVVQADTLSLSQLGVTGTLALSALRSAGSLIFGDLGAQTLSLPALTQVASFDLHGLGALTQLEAPALASVGAANFYGLPALTLCDSLPWYADASKSGDFVWSTCP